MRVIVDGNIGSGKTTQIELLKKLGFQTKKEPIEHWPLKQFYEDPPRWAFLLQMKILESYSDAPEGYVYERCMTSSKDVFWKCMVDSGIASSIEDKVYEEWFHKVVWNPDVLIYLRSKPEKCFERIQTRHQTGDAKISLDYLQKIHSYYEDMHKDYTIDVDDKTPEEVHEEILSVLQVEDAMHLADHNRS
jgi:deoxyadenosine/deoxycytidine kinase